MRLFAALDISAPVRNRIQRFIEGVSAFAPEARWVGAESLHVTLKFIGEQSDGAIGKVKEQLSTAKGGALDIRFQGCGFFPGPRRPRIFWIGVEAGPDLASLAASIDESLAKLGVSKEIHFFNPHITLARCGSGAPHLTKSREPETESESRFRKLQEKLQGLAIPEFGRMTAHEFFLFHSHACSRGPVYTKIASFALR